MKTHLAWLCLVPLGAIQVFPAAGEPVPEEPRPAALLFRGQPRSACTCFLIMETGFSMTSLGGPAGTSQELLTGETGLMVNVSPRTAVGVTFLYELGDDKNRHGITARYRRWLTEGSARNWSIDVSGGLLLGGESEYGFICTPPSGDRLTCREETAIYPSPVAGLGLNYGDLFSFTTQVEYMRFDGGESDWGVYTGIRLGSYLSLIAGLGLAIGAGIAMATMGPILG